MSDERERCDAQDNFYRCTRPLGHGGIHQAKDGCLIAHSWLNDVDPPARVPLPLNPTKEP